MARRLLKRLARGMLPVGALTSILVGGCTEGPTQVTLLLTTDLPCSELSEVSIASGAVGQID